jgi:hypothetical protein
MLLNLKNDFKKQIMVTGKLIIVLLFLFSTLGVLNAQENKVVVLNLKTGYSVKGEIVEQTGNGVKLRTSDGEIFEYSNDEMVGASDASSSSTGKQLFSRFKAIPLTVDKGDMIFGVGMGFFGNKVYDKLVIPTIPLTFEYIVLDNLFEGKGALGCGGYFGYSLSKVDYYGYSTYKSSMLIIGARGYLHYAFVEKLDTYGGILLGYKHEVSRYIDYDSEYNNKFSEGNPTANIFVGCRYFFNDRIAGMAELGWDLSVITLGLAIRL